MQFNNLKENCDATEICHIGHSIYQAYSEENWTSETHMIQIFAKLYDLNQNLKTAIATEKVKSNLKEKNIPRNQSIEALFDLIQGAKYHPNSIVKQATASLMSFIQKYESDFRQENYLHVTTHIDSLLKDLNILIINLYGVL